MAKRPTKRPTADSTSDGRQKLDEYRDKRDFDRTAEPAGADATGAPEADRERRFVVQRHRARRLHYDLRLEVDGTLASWAVPKGPTLDPTVRSLAVHVEDHPLEYADFEGVIPSGEYGGGDVIVWDRGTWRPSGTDDPAAAIAAGELHFDVESDKLAGRFVLVRTDRERSAREQWLLLHKKDEHAQAGWSPEDHPRSVKSGRTNDEVAAAPEALWRSDLPAAEAEVPVGTAAPRWESPTPDELAALDDLGAGGRWELQGKVLTLTDLDKALFPGRDADKPITKRELVRYYATVAPTMLAYLEDRPVDIHRYPGGVGGRGVWQRAVPRHAPGWIDRWRDEADPGDTAWHPVLDTPPAVAWMANHAAIELHPWTSRRADVHRPTWAFVDIGPGERGSFDDVLVLARLYRTALDHLGIEAGPKVTGTRGIQIWVPIRPGPTFDETRARVESLSRAVARTVPDLVSWERTGHERQGPVRLDDTQNALDRTLAAPYSVRAAPGAPVSVPLTWDELDDPDLRPDRWTLRTVGDRLATVGDPFSVLVGREQDLPIL